MGTYFTSADQYIILLKKSERKKLNDGIRNCNFLFFFKLVKNLKYYFNLSITLEKNGFELNYYFEKWSDIWIKLI